MITFLLYTLFFLSAALLIFIILIQEGKGGGIADAFGGAGAQTFGVRAGGVNKVTMILFGVFLISAVVLNLFGRDSNEGSVIQDALSAPVTAPAEPTGSAPSGNQ